MENARRDVVSFKFLGENEVVESHMSKLNKMTTNISAVFKNIS